MPDNARTWKLPPRYHADWSKPFDELIAPALVPGARILEVGAGASPYLPTDRRPPGHQYVAMDVSERELDKAPPGSYSEQIVADIVDPQPDLAERFDLILSWQVLEHVRPLDIAIENMRTFLRPTGRMVAQLSGSHSVFALMNRAIPTPVAIWAMDRLLGRAPDSVFPAAYDRCYYDALVSMLAPWREGKVIPRHAGATYFGFSPLLQRGYLKYEEWIIANLRHNLASHYLIRGIR